MLGGRKGQGLPISFIVLAVMGLLVLVIVLTITGVLPKLFSSTKMMADAATPEQVTGFRIGCEQACFQAKQLADTENEWKWSEYCTRKIKTEQDAETHCWESPVSVDCTKTTELGIFGAIEGNVKCTS